jgi:hypothetical protein
VRSGVWPPHHLVPAADDKWCYFRVRSGRFLEFFVKTAVVTAEFSRSVSMVVWSRCFLFLISLLLSRFYARWGVLATVIFLR